MGKCLTSLLVVDRTKRSKKIKDLNSMINKLLNRHLYNTAPNNRRINNLSSTKRSFTKIDHTLSPKSSLTSYSLTTMWVPKV